MQDLLTYLTKHKDSQFVTDHQRQVRDFLKKVDAKRICKSLHPSGKEILTVVWSDKEDGSYEINILKDLDVCYFILAEPLLESAWVMDATFGMESNLELDDYDGQHGAGRRWPERLSEDFVDTLFQGFTLISHSVE